METTAWLQLEDVFPYNPENRFGRHDSEGVDSVLERECEVMLAAVG